MHENPRLFTNDEIQTKTKTKIKMRYKTSIQDYVLEMNIKNTNPSCSKNLAYTVKLKKKHFKPLKQALLAPNKPY